MYVDEMVLVDTDAICAAIKDVFEDTRAVLEPAGALAVAGAKAYAAKHRLKRRDAGRGGLRRQHQLRPPALRRRAAEIGEQREAVLAVTMPEKPGSLQEVLRADRARATSPSSTTATTTRGGARLRRHPGGAAPSR
jgi:threonine dehydratase